MSATQTLVIQGTAQNSVAKTITRSNESLTDLSFSVGPSQTDQQQTLAIDVSEVKQLLIVSDKAVTMEWNDNAGAQGSIVLVPDEPVVWWDTAVWTNPLGSTDLSTSFWTNGSGTDTANVNLMVLSDASP